MREAQAQEELTAIVAQLAGDLAAVIALESDPALQTWLRSQLGARDLEPVHVRVGASEIWALLDARGAILVRQAPPFGARFDLFTEVRRDPALLSRLHASIRQTGAKVRAEALLAFVFDSAKDPSRRSMSELLRRAPLLEQTAYRFVAGSITSLQTMRRDIYASTESSGPRWRRRLQAYWRLALASSHLNLVATSKASRGWLVDMSNSFEWIEWTPSLCLVQERSLWFGAVAARSVTAFGDAVVEKYLRALALADQPMRAFDATFALLAIALDAPRVAPALRQALAGQAQVFRRQGGPYGPLQANMLENALTCLADPEAADRAFLKAVGTLGQALEQGRGLLGRAAIRLDLTTPIDADGYLGFLSLPRLLRTPLLDLYPGEPVHLSASGLPPSEIAAHLAQAFSGASRNPLKVH
ncbi:hypothetical protein ASE02_06245 [Phenylobacterium sp. Root700]|nr:hypothetical protein ASE02_06245 [Phenylobacterium sp. Root700]